MKALMLGAFMGLMFIFACVLGPQDWREIPYMPFAFFATKLISVPLVHGHRDACPDQIIPNKHQNG